MLIRKVSAGTFDIFGDKGFDSWTRVRKYHWGVKIVAGIALPRQTIRDVVSAIEAAPNGSLENVNA